MYQIPRHFRLYVRIPLLLALSLLFIASPLSSAGDWAETVQDGLYLEQPRTLKGKAFLDHPISDAAVKIYDRYGTLLHTEALATGEDGSFSITRRFPAAFWIVIEEGLMEAEPFDHEVRRYVPEFSQGKFYKVNAITTLMAEYQERHPDSSHAQVKAATAGYLEIPETVDIDEVIYASEWFSYRFSHYFFMREAEPTGGLTPFIDLLMDEVEIEATRPFYDLQSVGSTLFKDAMKELAKGAVSKLGGTGAGWILGLLAGGDGDDKRFDEMQSDLDSILSDLTEIKSLLKDLLKQLSITANEIETYIKGGPAQTAVTNIKNLYDGGTPNNPPPGTLAYFSTKRSEDSDDTLKMDVGELADNILYQKYIATQVGAIHDAINPDIGGTEGLLDLWTDKAILTGNISDSDLMDYYQTLERYFSMLLFYQFKGANLEVEAWNYRDKEHGTTGNAEAYLASFQDLLKAETDRFMYNVSRMIVANSGLYWESRFLPSTAREILARATWFVSQTLGEDHYGVRLGILGTKNLTDDVVAFAVTDDPGSSWAELAPVTAAEIDMESRPYDAWGTLNDPDLATLTRGTEYTLLAADFGDAVSAPGSYGAHFEPGTRHQTSWISMDDVVVKRYTDNYIEDPDGEILYGYSLAALRRGGKEVIMDHDAFDPENSVTHDGARFDQQNLWWGMGPSSLLHLHIEGHNKYTNESASLDMHWGRKHTFTYRGSESVTAYLNVAAKGAGHLYVDDGTYPAQAYAGFWFGIEDLGSGHYDHDGKTIDYVQGTKNIDESFGYQIQTTLEPGHRYSVYAHLSANGHSTNGDFDFWLNNQVSHLSLTFVNREFGP